MAVLTIQFKLSDNLSVVIYYVSGGYTSMLINDKILLWEE